jgi:F0F1-type ATP synthase epsilon subunit
VAPNKKKEKLHLRIYTRQGVLFDSEINSLSSRNVEGKFDVLREHAQFISIIKEKITIRLINGTVQEVPLDNAVMRVKGEEVQVFLGIKQG